jgi:hypothetical protein
MAGLFKTPASFSCPRWLGQEFSTPAQVSASKGRAHLGAQATNQPMPQPLVPAPGQHLRLRLEINSCPITGGHRFAQHRAQVAGQAGAGRLSQKRPLESSNWEGSPSLRLDLPLNLMSPSKSALVS